MPTALRGHVFEQPMPTQSRGHGTQNQGLSMSSRYAPVVFALIGVVGCAPTAVDPAAAPGADAPDSPAAIPVGPPQRQQLKRIVEQPGRVEALAQTPLHAKVSGFVKAWHKDIGDPVEAGTPLADIAVPELEQELLQKQAMVAQA